MGRRPCAHSAWSPPGALSRLLEPGAFSGPCRLCPTGPPWPRAGGQGRGVQQQLSHSPVWFSPASRNSASSPRSAMCFATDLHFLCALSSDVYKQWTVGKVLEGAVAARGGGGERCAWESPHCCDHHLSHNPHQEGPESRKMMHHESCPGQSQQAELQPGSANAGTPPTTQPLPPHPFNTLSASHLAALAHPAVFPGPFLLLLNFHPEF